VFWAAGAFLLWCALFLPDFLAFLVDLAEEFVGCEEELPWTAAKLATDNGIAKTPTINSVINFFILVSSVVGSSYCPFTEMPNGEGALIASIGYNDPL
jgi:hypothetical protein